jgi:hypothetical protein
MAILGMPSDEVITNSRRWPLSRFHITGLFESTVPGKVMVLAGVSTARSVGAAAKGELSMLSSMMALQTAGRTVAVLELNTRQVFPSR